jgi:hypothetical protein
LYELLESSNEEDDKHAHKYREMTNRNLVRNFFADEKMTDKECDDCIQVAFDEKSLMHSHILFLIAMMTKKMQCQNNH